MTNFWTTIRDTARETGQPFFCLAPMADVTDPAFRRIVAKYSRHHERGNGGGPDVLWTEFVSADGLCHPVGREKLVRDLAYTDTERPIVAQLFSSRPDNMRAACKLCAELGFDGVDINMGCPDRTIEKQGCGSAMIKTPDLAIQIIRAARAGVAESGRDIPVSVKTRVGYSTPDISGWIGALLAENLDALTIHARTRRDLSDVPANWDYVRQVVKLRDQISPDTVIIGNGDVVDLADGMDKARASGCEGVMIGRAVFGNPWIFDHHRTIVSRGGWNPPWYLRFLPRTWTKKIMGDSRYTVSAIDIREKLRVMMEHSELFMELLGDIKNFAIMKKHYKAYCTGFPGAKELRIKLMESRGIADAHAAVEEFLKRDILE